MDELIITLNNIRDAMIEANVEIDFELPQIVVVGEQSAGKTSVLENFVGKDFLPRGSGIVTRRPLILQMIKTETEQEYGMFLHLKDKKIYDLKEVCKEIGNETNRLLGNKKNVSDIPISLKIFSKNVLDLTLIDMPGLTKIAVGDQSSDVPKNISDMVIKFISNPNSIILVVVAANVDLANSEALRLAKQVDPMFFRTIGVITKIDLMDKGTNCRSILDNKAYPLLKGWVGVVNRSQKDTNEMKPIEVAQEEEINFFKNDENYKHLEKNLGTKNLQRILNNELKSAIFKNLPRVNEKLRDMMIEQENILKIFGVGSFSEYKMDDTRTILNIVQEFVKKIENQLGVSQSITNLEEISIGANIQIILNQLLIYEFKKETLKSFNIREMIHYGLQNAECLEGYIEVPNSCMKSVLREIISLFHPIIMKLFKKVKHELELCIEKSIDEMCIYSTLNSKMREITVELIQKSFSELETQIDFFVEIERNHINLRHPDFIENKDLTDLTVHFQNYKSQAKVVNCEKFNDVNFIELKGDSLIFCKRKKSLEILGTIPLQGCKLKTVEKNKKGFRLFNPDLKYIIYNNEFIEIMFESSLETNTWKAVFLSHGVIHEEIEKIDGFDMKNLPQHTITAIEKVRCFVEKYINVVTKNLLDLSVKFCMHLTIVKFDDFLRNELFLKICTDTSEEKLLEIDEEKKQKLDDEMKKYEMIKLCLSHIEKHIFGHDNTSQNLGFLSLSTQNLNASEEYQLPEKSQRKLSGSSLNPPSKEKSSHGTLKKSKKKFGSCQNLHPS